MPTRRGRCGKAGKRAWGCTWRGRAPLLLCGRSRAPGAFRGKKGGQNVCWAECVSAVSVLRMERAGEKDGRQRESGGELGREAPPGLLSAPCSLQLPHPRPPTPTPPPPLLGLWSHFRAELCWGLFLCGAPPICPALSSSPAQNQVSPPLVKLLCLFV